MADIKFGPAGLGGVDEAVSNLNQFSRGGLKACEIAFTYGVYIKESEAVEIGKEARKLGVELSIHAPYYVNLNSKERAKVKASKERILKCCEVGHHLSFSGHKTRVVFHSGFYSGMDEDEAYNNIKKEVFELLEIIKENKWNVELCPEVVGKKNVFGSIEEISKLSKETGCGFCIDFAHILARYGKYEFGLVEKAFPQKKWHCHFSGIEYGDKGEKNHKKTSEEDWKEVLGFMKKLDKEIVVINESPSPIEDSILGFEIYSD